MAPKAAPAPAPAPTATAAAAAAAGGGGGGWEAAPPHEQLFVLITGANSGVGFGTAQRLIDDFVASRSPAAHLVLLLTTRSPDKSRQAIADVRAHAARVAAHAARVAAAAARVHVLGLALDLCDLRAVRALARRLVYGTVGNPDLPGGAPDPLSRVRVPRLDCVIFNAAYGGWEGCDYPMAIWSILTKGLIQSVTWPDFKKPLPTLIINEQQSYGYPVKPLLGEVFTACVFGHYMLAHELLPLLGRSEDSPLPPGRIVWSSSLEAVEAVFASDDLQCLTGRPGYESAKRLTDLLALTHSLPAARPYSSRWLAMDRHDDDDDDEKTRYRPPNVYLSHPGVVASTLFPVPWFFFWAYYLVLVLSRWFGSPWHNVDAYSGAKAAAWLALEPQEALDDARAHRIKWGSSSDRQCRVHVKKTEVEGWGWEGRPQAIGAPDDDDATSPFYVLRKNIGRKYGTPDTTAEDIVRFEELGAACWREMEDMRTTWQEILDNEESFKDA